MQPTEALTESKIPGRQSYLQPSHSTTNVFLIISAHIGLFGSYALLTKWFEPALSLLLFAPLCCAHQKYISEWIHEGAHYNILPSRVWNDFITNWFAGVFFANNVAVHRLGHFIHHRFDHFFIPGDPDTGFLRVDSRPELLREVTLDLCGWSALKLFFSSGTPVLDPRVRDSKLRFVFLVASVHLILIALLYWFASVWPYVIYYGVMLTLYPLMNRLRVYGQHVTIGPNGGGNLDGATSRTLVGGIFDRFFFNSSLMMFHHEHHLHPHLPYRALREICKPETDINKFGSSRVLVIRALWRGLEW